MKRRLKIGCGMVIAVFMIFTASFVDAASFISMHESYNNEQNRYTYDGVVRVSIDDMSITCDKAVWSPSEKFLEANGNVDVRDGSITLRSVSLSMVEESGEIKLFGDTYFHVQGLTVTAGNIVYSKNDSTLTFSKGVLVSTNGTKTLYHSAIYDLAGGTFREYIK